MGNRVEKPGWENAARRLNIAEPNGGIPSPTIQNNREEIVKALEEIRVEAKKNFREAHPQRGTPARLFFDNAFEAMNLLEDALTKGKGLYISDVNNPDASKSYMKFAGGFTPDKPDHIYIRTDRLLLPKGFEKSEEIKELKRQMIFLK